MKARGIPGDQRPSGPELRPHRNLAVDEALLTNIEGTLDARVNVYRPTFDREAPADDLGQVEQIVNQARLELNFR